MFENKSFEGIYYSRFIASWMKATGCRIDHRFVNWLATLTINGKSIPQDVIKEIYDLGTNGKMELELSAQFYINRENEAV